MPSPKLTWQIRSGNAYAISRGRKGLTLAEALIMVLVMILLFAITCAVFSKRRDERLKAECLDNLYKTGLWIGYMVAKHGPDSVDLSNLKNALQYADFGLHGGEPRISSFFFCPTDHNRSPVRNWSVSSYRGIGPLFGQIDNVIVAYERESNHPGGRCVLFLHLDTEFIPNDQLKKRLAESLAMVKKNWDSYTPNEKARIEAFYRDEPEPTAKTLDSP